MCTNAPDASNEEERDGFDSCLEWKQVRLAIPRSPHSLNSLENCRISPLFTAFCRIASCWEAMLCCHYCWDFSVKVIQRLIAPLKSNLVTSWTTLFHKSWISNHNILWFCSDKLQIIFACPVVKHNGFLFLFCRRHASLVHRHVIVIVWTTSSSIFLYLRHFVGNRTF